MSNGLRRTLRTRGIQARMVASGSVVLAGPGSTMTIPGIIVSEIAQALAQSRRSPASRST